MVLLAVRALPGVQVWIAPREVGMVEARPLDGGGCGGRLADYSGCCNWNSS